MRSSRIFHRLEITFWDVTIRVMDNHKVFLWVPPIITIIVLGLLAVPITTWAINELGPHQGFPNSGSSSLLMVGHEKVFNSHTQRNVLVVVVDDLTEEENTLRSVWILASLPYSTQLTWLPIYPETHYSDWSEYLNLSFSLEEDGGLVIPFQNAISEMGLDWDNYIVIDEFAVAYLESLVWGKETEIDLLVDLGNNKRQDLSENQIKQRLLGQVSLAKELCDQAPDIFQLIDPLTLIERLSGHLLSDFSITAVSAGWFRLRDEGGVYACEFPTLRETIAVVPLP